MSRYIDADALIADLDKGLWGKDWDKVLAEAIINDAPSIDTVRCKECKHWNEEDHWCNIRDSYGWDYKPDDFCSYGEREDE